jgi:hypothetical protein
VDDESLLGFEDGSIITIVERNADGWWQGELDGKRGMFPMAKVELIITDASDVTLIPIARALRLRKAEEAQQRTRELEKAQNSIVKKKPVRKYQIFFIFYIFMIAFFLRRARPNDPSSAYSTRSLVTRQEGRARKSSPRTSAAKRMKVRKERKEENRKDSLFFALAGH